MTTILLDLDNTLLQNPVDQFVPAYLKLFASEIAHIVDPKLFSHTLLDATDKMILNDDCTKYLQTSFEEHFFSVFSDQKEFLAREMEEFYLHQYPTLRSFTHPRSEAVELVKDAIDHQFNVVVATNPLFPAYVQAQRLNWADLSLADYPEIRFVTSYEKLHFAKPNPAYYAEILALLGWPEGPICMIGDTLSEDVLPSEKLGINGFLITNGNGLPADTPDSINYGSLSDANKWSKGVSAELQFKTQESVLFELMGTSAALDTLSHNKEKIPQFSNATFSQTISDLSAFTHEVIESLFDKSQTIRPLSDENQFFSDRVRLIETVKTLSNDDFCRVHDLLGELVAFDQKAMRKLDRSFSASSPFYLRSILNDL